MEKDVKKPVRIAPNGSMAISTCNLNQTGLGILRPIPITTCLVKTPSGKSSALIQLAVLALLGVFLVLLVLFSVFLVLGVRRLGCRCCRCSCCRSARRCGRSILCQDRHGESGDKYGCQ